MEAQKRNQYSPDGYILAHNNNNNNTVSVRSRNHSQQNVKKFSSLISNLNFFQPKVEYRSSVYHSRHALSSHSEEVKYYFRIKIINFFLDFAEQLISEFSTNKKNDPF